MIEDITQARKILFVTPSLRLRDGITANSLNLMRGWLESGFEVLVLNPSKFGMEVEGLFSSSQSFVAYLEGESAFSNITESEYVADTAVIQYAISAYWFRTYWIHRWLKLTSVKSVVLCCHEPIREIKLLKGLGKRIYASAFKNCYKIVLFSAHACELVKTLTDKEVEVYSLPVPKRGVSQGSQSAHPHFLMLGYYLRDKGFEMGLESFIAALRATKTSIVLSVIVSVRERVGSARIFSYRDRRNFEEFQNQLTQAQNDFPASINIFGYLTDVEMESVISTSDYLLMPYVQITNSGVAATAKAHGIPVISSDLKPLIEAFGESAFFFSAGSRLDLQERLESIISDPNWKIEREKRAQQMVGLAALNSAFDVAVDMVDIRFS
jgi:glycosyltransferase involved in cell wall biosynthesis